MSERREGSPAAEGPRAMPGTRDAAIEVALQAYGALLALAETVEDEWTYVTALAAAGRARIVAAGALPGGASTGAAPVSSPGALGAVGLAAAEIQAITDPHRAIDWLSTFPAVIELALAGPVPEAPPAPPAAPRPPPSGRGAG